LRKAFFLDLDGVIISNQIINGKPVGFQNLDNIRFLEDVDNAIEQIKNHGYLPIIVTNQPNISRKILSEDSIIKLKRIIECKFDIHHFYYCPHDDKDECICRKPKPGLIIKAQVDLSVDLNQSVLVGDRWKDISAGQGICVRNYFINRKYSEPKPKSPYIEVSNLIEAVLIEIRRDF
jgi:D-glycero-D-manno-heptose 1,7-bisphosphate phosphatase